MKKIIYISSILLIIIGCSKENNPISPDNSNNTSSSISNLDSSNNSSSSENIDTNQTIKFNPQFNINYLDSIDTTKYDLESISFGSIDWILQHKRVISLKDDNNDPTLPDTYRTWFYTPVCGLDTSNLETIFINNRGWDTYFVPVYSYDQKTWTHFDEKEITKTEPYTLTISKKFKEKIVWLARFYPYTLNDLNRYINSISSFKYLNIDTLGFSPNNNPIYDLEFTDKTIPDSTKKVIWIHARTHPAENGSAFVIEGFINTIISNNINDSIFKKYIFHIVPIHNIDGVIAGNYRTNTLSQNLEMGWILDNKNNFFLDEKAPLEVKLLHSKIMEIIKNKSKFIIALNLHSSNSDPDKKTFFFAHFGTDSSKYANNEISLFYKQKNLIENIKALYPNIQPVSEGSNSFVNKTYPESWWWANFRDSVIAMTLETTYSKAGFDHWVTPNDQRELGKSVLLGIINYIKPKIIL